MTVDVSIIIVTYNVPDLLRRCLATIPESTDGLSTEVLVVDNGSRDGTWDSIASRADVQAIRGSRELGFGRGNNLAAARARGRWLLFLNPDTELMPLGLRRLVERGDADASLGILGPRLELADGSLDPAACRSFPTPASAAMRLLRWPRRLPPRGVRPYNVAPSSGCEAMVDAVSGACMLVRAEAFRRVGGFDPQFFTYGEDLDLAYRIRQGGWPTLFVPSVVVRHLKRQSTRQRAVRARVEFYRAIWLYYRKHRQRDGLWLRAMVTTAIVVLALGAVARQGALRMLALARRKGAVG
ncbi:MAG: glycosyltransferase family 2 protein [Chloroflexi bacterium]|nr:glycosyltransferase family 2 protein [Chloroflexota bacterium]